MQYLFNNPKMTVFDQLTAYLSGPSFIICSVIGARKFNKLLTFVAFVDFESF